jgi:hypothetical protein
MNKLCLFFLKDEIKRKRLDPNEKYPGFELMKSYSNNNGQNDVFRNSEPKSCVIQMINMQLKVINIFKQITVS